MMQPQSQTPTPLSLPIRAANHPPTQSLFVSPEGTSSRLLANVSIRIGNPSESGPSAESHLSKTERHLDVFDTNLVNSAQNPTFRESISPSHFSSIRRSHQGAMLLANVSIRIGKPRKSGPFVESHPSKTERQLDVSDINLVNSAQNPRLSRRGRLSIAFLFNSWPPPGGHLRRAHCES